MALRNTLQQKNMSVYRLAKVSGIPYATCNDIVNGKTQLEKCSAETVYHLAHALDVPMETLLKPYLLKRSSFENFKSTICHSVKEKGDITFIMATLESGDIRTYYERGWYPESLYLLAMLDYLCRVNGIPLCEEYDDIRGCKLENVVYPASLVAVAVADKDNGILEQAVSISIPEFIRYNIVESEIRNVI